MATETTKCECGWPMPEKISVGVDAAPDRMSDVTVALKSCRFVFYTTCPNCGSEWECDGGTNGIGVKARAEA